MKATIYKNGMSVEIEGTKEEVLEMIDELGKRTPEITFDLPQPSPQYPYETGTPYRFLKDSGTSGKSLIQPSTVS